MTTTDQLDARIEGLRRQLAEAEAEREQTKTVGEKIAEEMVEIADGEIRVFGDAESLKYLPLRHRCSDEVKPETYGPTLRKRIAHAIDQAVADALAARPASPAPADLPSAEDVADEMVGSCRFGGVKLITICGAGAVTSEDPHVDIEGRVVLFRGSIASALRARDACWRAKVAEEREACAQIADDLCTNIECGVWHYGENVSRAIRARKD